MKDKQEELLFYKSFVPVFLFYLSIKPKYLSQEDTS